MKNGNPISGLRAVINQENRIGRNLNQNVINHQNLQNMQDHQNENQNINNPLINNMQIRNNIKEQIQNGPQEEQSEINRNTIIIKLNRKHSNNDMDLMEQ